MYMQITINKYINSWRNRKLVGCSLQYRLNGTVATVIYIHSSMCVSDNG